MDLIPIQRALCRAVGALEFGSPVACVYNPLVYARRGAEEYLRRYARSGIEALLVGMNPGPFGMVQTGVPFGEVAAARDWLRICEPVDRPAREHPARPVLGFACARSEVSGPRLWGFARDRFGTPERFFRRFFVWNYCPLAFVTGSGANVTPDKLSADDRERLFPPCDRALRKVVLTLAPRAVVGIGGFAAQRAQAALAGLKVPVGQVLHPSPASPLANRGWADQVERQLRELGIELPQASA